MKERKNKGRREKAYAIRERMLKEGEEEKIEECESDEKENKRKKKDA